MTGDIATEDALVQRRIERDLRTGLIDTADLDVEPPEELAPGCYRMLVRAFVEAGPGDEAKAALESYYLYVRNRRRRRRAAPEAESSAGPDLSRWIR